MRQIEEEMRRREEEERKKAQEAGKNVYGKGFREY